MGIFLTGGSGKLGSAIRNSGLFPNILAPSHQELDITDEKSVERYVKDHDFEGIIHVAALKSLLDCEKDPARAILINVLGTANLVRAVIAKNISLRFTYISTDGVYEGTKGNYSESDGTIPYSNYGWTKLGGECAVRLLSNACIIRSSFFDPDDIPFEDAPDDMYSSKLPVKDFVQSISKIYFSKVKGILNVGCARMSLYEIYKQYKHGLKRSSFDKIRREVSTPLAKDCSLDSTLFKKLF